MHKSNSFKVIHRYCVISGLFLPPWPRENDVYLQLFVHSCPWTFSDFKRRQHIRLVYCSIFGSKNKHVYGYTKRTIRERKLDSMFCLDVTLAENDISKRQNNGLQTLNSMSQYVAPKTFMIKVRQTFINGQQLKSIDNKLQ